MPTPEDLPLIFSADISNTIVIEPLVSGGSEYSDDKHQPKDSKKLSNKEIGRQGELVARRLLELSGYEILETNWKCPAGEADIIALDGNMLVFVEVKTRTQIEKGLPSEAVGPKKRKRYEKIATYYLKDHMVSERPVRFDVIGILAANTDRALLRHHINAFGGA